jgi:pimeloyl-ACP methyl ester carboxylesterase
MDTSQLLTYIPSYIFPMSTHTITHNMILGISLGAHAAWQCLFHDPRITSAIIIIGCPDYVRLMSDRARLSKLDSWTQSSPKGSTFLGSKDFPNGLIEAVEKHDPAGLLLGGGTSRDDIIYSRDPTAMEKRSLIPLMKSTLQNKRILNMSGGADKLVPYKCAEPFLRWLKNATSPAGWFKEGNVILEDIVFEGVKHEMSPGMVKEVHRFVCDTLDQPGTTETGRRLSKI